MLAPVLNTVHRQRIARAVEAAQAGERVILRVDGDGDTSFVVWVSRYRHVIAAGSERGMAAMLPLAQMEFERQLIELGKESGAAVGV